MCTFICTLFTLLDIIPLYCTLPLASAEENKLTLSRAIGECIYIYIYMLSFLSKLGREDGNPSLRLIIPLALSHLS